MNNNLPLLTAAKNNNYKGPPILSSVGRLDDGELPVIYFNKRPDHCYSEIEKKELSEYYEGRAELDFVNIPKDLLSSFKPNNFVKMQFKGRKCGFFIYPDTVFFPSPTGEYVALITHKNAYCHFPDDVFIYPCMVKGIMPMSILKMFMPFYEVNAVLNDLHTYSKLTGAQRALLEKRAAAPDCEDEDDEIASPLINPDELHLMYRLCRHTLSKKMCNMLDTNFSILTSRSDSKVKGDALTQISYALNIDISPKKLPCRKSYNEIMSLLDRNLYGMEKLKEELAEFILYMQYSGTSHFKILLAGSPGVGKTAISEIIAQILDKPVVPVNCSGRGALDIFGSTKNYTGAQPSEISRGLYMAGTNNVVLFLDEFDKMAANDNDGNPYSAFTSALDFRCRFNDAFFDESYAIPLNNTNIICTVNDISNVPDYIRNRFDLIFYCDDYDTDTKVKIAENHIIPKQLKTAGIRPHELVFDINALYEIADCCTDKGARQMEAYIKAVIRKAIKYWQTGRYAKPLKVDRAFVKENLYKTDSAKRPIGFRPNGGESHV